MKILSTHFSESTEGARAEVVEDLGQYKIRYYDMNGNYILTEHHQDKSIHYVESAARNWAAGIKNLNG